jgi:hypothetical protein
MPKSAKIAQLGAGLVCLVMTCLGRVKKIHQRLTCQVFFFWGGGVQIFFLPPSLSLGSIGDTASWHLANQHGKDLLPL